LQESEAELERITTEIGQIEDEMEQVMAAIMHLGVNTLHLEQELYDSWDFAKNVDEQLADINFDRR